MNPVPTTVTSRELAIDHPEHCVGVAESGRCKYWLREEPAAAPAAALASIDLAVPASARPTPVRDATSAILRHWRHRPPRPEAFALLARLDAAPTAWTFLHPALPGDARKPLPELLAEAWTAAATTTGSFPLGPHRVSILRWVDDGPSSPDGIRQGAEVLFRELILAAYRRGRIGWL